LGTASTASFVTLAQTASFVTLAQTASFVTTAQTASFVAGANVNGNITGNAANITAYTVNQNVGTSNSPTFAGLTIQGNLTAQQYIVSSSVTYLTESFASGSHNFGDSIDDTHKFTGSVLITGSANITGPISASIFTGSFTGSLQGTATTASYVLGSGVSGNISGNAANITAYTINQNLGTSNQVSFQGVTASFNGTLTTPAQTNITSVGTLTGLVVTSASPSTASLNVGLTYVSGALGVGTATPSTVGLIRATNDIIAFYGSDERLKENIFTISGSLDILKQINGYYFDWKKMPGIHENEGHDIGVIAQEIEKVLPEIVTTRDNGYLAVKYEKLVALLIQTNKELLARVEALEEKIK
jgi:hypothetical protein